MIKYEELNFFVLMTNVKMGNSSVGSNLYKKE